MKYSISILALLIFAGCSATNADTEDVFESYTIGNWEIVSPRQANFIGENSPKKAKSAEAEADTIDIKSPGQRDLKLIKPAGTSDTYFTAQFIDSTINYDYYKQHNIRRAVLIAPVSNLPENQNPNHPDVLVMGSGAGTDWNSDHAWTRFSGHITCYPNEFESSNPVILIRYEKEDGTMVRAYRIFVNGILEAVHEITTC
ncbi:MAG: hypothetical protein WED82_01875 [Balneolales bacterium]